MVAMVGSTASFIVVPGMLGLVVDQMDKPDNEDDINRICIIMGIVVVGTAFFVFLRGASFNTMSDAIAKNIRYDVFF